MKRKVIIKPIIASILTLMASFSMLPIKGYAVENINGDISIIVDMNNAFAESEGEYDYIEKKKEEESVNVTGLIDKDVEIILNSNGILDEDIKKYSKEELQELEKNIDEDSIIYVSYYAVNDTEELSDVPVKKDEMIELTPKQVDKYIAEKYYDEETDLMKELVKEFNNMEQDNKKEKLVNKVSDIMGINVNEVCAETISHGGIHDKDNPTMLKETLVINDIEDSYKMYVWFQFEWTEMPKYRYVDTVGLYWDGAMYDSGYDKYAEQNVKHKWLETYIYHYTNEDKCKCIANGNDLKYRYNPKDTFKEEQYYIRSNYIVCLINMHDDQPYSYNPVPTEVLYENERVEMRFYLVKLERATCVSFYPQYVHLKQKFGYDFEHIACAIISGIGKDYIAVSYYLLSGLTSSYTKSTSGPIDVPYQHVYK